MRLISRILPFALLLFNLTLVVILTIWFGIWGIILFVLMLIGQIADSIVRVEAPNVGMIFRLGERINRFLPEGLNFKWPFIDRVELFSREMLDNKVECTVYTKFTGGREPTKEDIEKGGRDIEEPPVQINIVGSYTYRPDTHSLWYLNRYFETSEEVIQREVTNAIKSRLGQEAGRRTIEDFINYREELEIVVNMILRGRDRVIEIMDQILNYLMRDLRDFKVGKENPHEKCLRRLKRLERAMFRERDRKLPPKPPAPRGTDEFQRWEEQYPRSWLEMRFGIKILNFYLAQPTFSPDVVKALEAQLQAMRQQLAASEWVKRTIKAAKVLEEAVGKEQAGIITRLLVAKAGGLDSSEVVRTINFVGGAETLAVAIDKVASLFKGGGK